MTTVRGAPTGPRRAQICLAGRDHALGLEDQVCRLAGQEHECASDLVGGVGVGDVEVAVLDEGVGVEPAAHAATTAGGADDGLRAAPLEQLVDAAMVGRVDEVERLGQELVGSDVAVEQDDGATEVGRLAVLRARRPAAGPGGVGRGRVGAGPDVVVDARRRSGWSGPVWQSSASKSTDSTVQPCSRKTASA